MHKNTPNISKLIDSLFPDHVVASYPKLIEFAKAFFEFLEKENKASYYQNTLQYQRDVREQDPEFLEYIQRELGVLNFQRFAADPKLFYDNLSHIWRAKGSEESIKAFFRLFLDDEVEIYYPWESVLIPSDGRWIVDTVIRVSKLLGDPEDFAGKRIFQVGSDAEAVVDRVERKVYSDGIIYELNLIPTTISGTFVEHKTIYANVTPSITLTAEVYKSVNRIKVNTPGTGYKVGDKITLTGYEGISFVANVHSINSEGGITEVSLVDFGSGNTPYSVIDSNDNDLYYLIDFILYEYVYDSSGELLTVLAQDYDTANPALLEINIQSEDGQGANLEINYGPLATYSGYYKGVKGQLSESIVLQDSKYYQKFSYEVKTKVSSDKWIQPLKKFAHPVGVEVISNVFTFEKLNVGIKNYYIFVRDQDPASYTFIEAPGISDRVSGVTQDYVENSPLYFAEGYVGSPAFGVNDSYNINIIAGQATQEILDEDSQPQNL